jgi:hypothetical protein
LLRRAAVLEEFARPNKDERKALMSMDLEGVSLSSQQIEALVAATGPYEKQPGWTYSDIRTRLYPSAMAQAFPDRALTFEDLHEAATALRPSPVMEDK